MKGPVRAGLESQIYILRQEKKDTTVMLRFLADRIDELQLQVDKKQAKR